MRAEIITLRAIALKQVIPKRLILNIRASRDHNATSYSTETRESKHPSSALGTEIITLRAIALKLKGTIGVAKRAKSRDHNATSYSTETAQCEDFFVWSLYAEIITLRAIALKLLATHKKAKLLSRDHNATSYSTETL